MNRMEDPLRWYALHTKSRQEKKLATRLTDRGVEAYTPLRKTLKQWSDRKKMVEEPLIRSYVFVKINRLSYDMVLNTPGAVRFIWFGGEPAAIPDRQIDLLKRVTGTAADVSVIPSGMGPGTPVKVIVGPLSGLTGELISVAGKRRVIVRIDHLDQALSLSIPAALLERVSGEQ
jgi:transcriptional antiterminator RfaH